MQRSEAWIPKTRSWKIGLRFLLLLAALSWTGSSFISCSPPEQALNTERRLLLTPFRGSSFGSVRQTPVLVVAEIAGRVRSRMCVLLQVEYSDTSNIRLQPNKGRIFTDNDPDLTDVVLAKYNECKQANRACLVGTIDTKQTELIVQAEFLIPEAGGLLVGAVYEGSCVDDDTFTDTNIIARQALALGGDFRNANKENKGDAGASESSTEAGSSDGGTDE